MANTRANDAVRELVDHYRAQCLWFLRADYYPHAPEEIDRVFRLIERYGDLDAFKRVAALRQWLSQTSSATSVDS